MSRTITKTKKVNTLEDIKEDNINPVQYVLKLSSTLQNTNEEIKSLRRELKANKHKNTVVVQGLLNRIRELEQIKAHNEKLLKELGAKEEYIQNMNDEMNNAFKEANKSLRSYKSTDDEINEEFSTEEIEHLNKQALMELEELLKST